MAQARRVLGRRNMTTVINGAMGGGARAVATAILNRQKQVLSMTGVHAEWTPDEMAEAILPIVNTGALATRLYEAWTQSIATRGRAATPQEVNDDQTLIDDLIAAVPNGLRPRVQRVNVPNAPDITVPPRFAAAVNVINQQFGGGGGGNLRNMGWYDQLVASNLVVNAAGGGARFAVASLMVPLVAKAVNIIVSMLGKQVPGQPAGTLFDLNSANAWLGFDNGGGRIAAITQAQVDGFTNGAAGAAGALGDHFVPYVFLVAGSIIHTLRAANTIQANTNAVLNLAQMTEFVNTMLDWLQVITKGGHVVDAATNQVRLNGAVGAKMARNAVGAPPGCACFATGNNTHIDARVFTPTQPRAVRVRALMKPAIDWYRVFALRVPAANPGDFEACLTEMMEFVNFTLASGQEWFECSGAEVCLMIFRLKNGCRSLSSIGQRGGVPGNFMVGGPGATWVIP